MEKPVLMYDKRLNRVYPDLEDIVLLNSSSAGNGTIIKSYRLLFDLGLPFKHYEPYLSDIKYIVLTHEHSDHLNLASLKRFIKNYGYTDFLMNQRMYDICNTRLKEKYGFELPDDRVITLEYDTSHVLDTKTDDKYLLEITKTPHGDIDNVAITVKGIAEIEGFEMPVILYASDLSTIEPIHLNNTYYEGLPINENKYDIMLLEANYNEDIIQEILEREPDNFRAQQNYRHLSENEAFKYVERMLKDNGIFIPLHASLEFGTFIQ